MRLLRLLKLLPRALRQRIVLGRIEDALRVAGLAKPERERLMKGWKTWAGGLALIGGGIAMAAKAIASGSFDVDEILKGVAMIGAGFSALGIGHKIEKNTDAIKEESGL